MIKDDFWQSVRIERVSYIFFINCFNVMNQGNYFDHLTSPDTKVRCRALAFPWRGNVTVVTRNSRCTDDARMIHVQYTHSNACSIQNERLNTIHDNDE